jgi:hypothetical protein
LEEVWKVPLGKHTGFWWANVKERGHYEDLHVDGSIILWRVWVTSLRNNGFRIRWIDLLYP